MSRRAIALAAAAVVVFFVVTLITLTHVITNSTPGCAIAAPAPSLPASLRALGGFDQSFDANNLAALAAHPVGQHLLAAVSCGAVFMGALTYIGNGPNFMVKAIAEQHGVRLPSFFGYTLWSLGILVPIFGVVSLVFF